MISAVAKLCSVHAITLVDICRPLIVFSLYNVHGNSLYYIHLRCIMRSPYDVHVNTMYCTHSLFDVSNAFISFGKYVLRRAPYDCFKTKEKRNSINLTVLFITDDCIELILEGSILSRAQSTSRIRL